MKDHSVPVFIGEIIIWAVSQTLSYHLYQDKSSPFWFLHLKSSGEKDLLLHLISPEVWQASEKSLPHGFFKEKAETLRKTGRLFVHLWEDVWFHKPEQVKERILTMLGYNTTLAGRLTVAREMTKHQATDFLEKWHVNGNVSSVYHYGLFLPERRKGYLSGSVSFDTVQDNELLVAVATFGPLRKMTRISDSYISGELIRFASLGGVSIPGGLAKLLAAFHRHHQTDDIMTYADLDWSDGRSYGKTGFIRKEDKPPITFYLNKVTMRRYSAAKSRNRNNEDVAEIVNSGSAKWVKYYSEV